MRLSDTLITAALAAALAGCGGYDRELLGDPEPAPAVQPAPDKSWNDPEAALADSLGYEEVIHTPSDYAMFSELSPYGEWYDTPEFGVVWRPLVPMDWRPYMHGHWMWTSYGWMWAAYDPFGWATYHYGNWWYDSFLGWVWVPGYAWAPCPVDWFYTDGYFGWAPLPPSGYYWDDPWQDTGKYKDGWVVVEAGKFKSNDVGEHRIAPSKFKDQYRIGTAERRAPDRSRIEHITRKPVKETDIRFETSRYGDRELRKVILPTHDQQIVDRNPTLTPLAPGSQTQLVIPDPVPSDAPQTKPSPGKTKNPATPPPSKDTSPPKFKEKRGSDSKGEGKDSGKSKGGDSKGEGKDSSGKAKGKR